MSLRSDNKRYRCLFCERISQSVYRKTGAGKTIRNRIARRFYKTDKGKADRKRFFAKHATDPQYQKMHQAAREVYRAIKSGILEREPCIICGDLKSQAHHFNYAKPLKVVWFCPEHHRMYHRKELTYV